MSKATKSLLLFIRFFTHFHFNIEIINQLRYQSLIILSIRIMVEKHVFDGIKICKIGFGKSLAFIQILINVLKAKT